jgi:hypothetical protein
MLSPSREAAAATDIVNHGSLFTCRLFYAFLANTWSKSFFVLQLFVSIVILTKHSETKGRDRDPRPLGHLEESGDLPKHGSWIPLCPRPPTQARPFLSVWLCMSKGRDREGNVHRQSRKAAGRCRQWKNCFGDSQSWILLWRDIHPQYGDGREQKDGFSQICWIQWLILPQ